MKLLQNKPLLSLIIFILGIYACCLDDVHCEIYKSVDKDGVIHFSNVPTRTNAASVRISPTIIDIMNPKVTKKNKPNTKPTKRAKSNTIKNTSIGTAWPIRYKYIVTNNHIIERKDTINVKDQRGNTFTAKRIAVDDILDIAILEVSTDDFSKIPASIPLSNSSPNLGARVFVMGYPLVDVMGFSLKVTDGIISAETGLRGNPHTCQISAPVQPGNSGSPLINMNGEVVGMVVGRLNSIAVLAKTGGLPQNVNYAIKVQYLKALLDSVPKIEPNMIEVLPSGAGSLEELANRIKDSVLLIEAK